MINWGSIPLGRTIPFMFDSYAAATGASITISGLAVGDIVIYKDASMTQRTSTAGFTLLDTDGIDIDGFTGIHGFSIDTNDNTDAGFYAAGSCYTVVVSSITVDAQTVSFVAGTFFLIATPTVLGVPEVDVTHWIGTAAATPTVAGVPEVDVTHWIGTAAATPTVAGVPEVDLTHIAGAVVSATTAQLGVNVVNINNNLASAQKLQQHYSACASGTSDSGSTTTMVDAARTEADTDYFKDMVILFTSGTLTGQSRRITAFDPATDTVTFAPATTAAVSTQTYIIFQGGTADVAAWLGTAVATPTVAGVPEVDMTHIDGLATAGNNATLNLKQLNVVNSAGTAIVAQGSGTGHGILAEALGSGDGINTASGSGNQISGNITGNLDGNVTGSVATVTTVNGLAANVITAASMAADASAEIADAVWDEDATAHQTQGTFGQAIGDPAADTNTIYKAVVTDATGATVGVDVAALPTAAANATALLDSADAIETGLTPRGALRLTASATAGKMSGAGTGTEVFRNAVQDSKNRITATVDASGNRTAITTDAT